MTSDHGSAPTRFSIWIAQKQGSVLAATVFVVVVGAFEIVPRFGPTDWILGFAMPAPFDSKEARIVLIFFVLLYLVIAIAAIFKSIEAREMEGWSTVEAVITRSQPGFQMVKRVKGLPTNHRIADIRYAFRLRDRDGNEQHFEGSRIRVGETIPEEEVPDLLARYPVKSRVKIRCDPRNPMRNVLELEKDGGRTVKGLLTIAIVFAGIALPVMWFFTQGISGLRTIPLGPLGWITLLCGSVSVFFFVAEARQRRWLASLRNWRKAPGVVISARIEAYDSGWRKRRSDGSIREFVTNYTPVVEYRYEVDGVTHLSRSIHADSAIGGSRIFAQAYADRYRPGSAVEVSFDPANPSRASLEMTRGFGWTFLVAGTGFALVGIATLVGSMR